MTNEFEAVRRQRVRVAGIILLVVVPIGFFLAMLSFGMTWISAASISALALAIAFGRWRLKEGKWPWQPPR